MQLDDDNREHCLTEDLGAIVKKNVESWTDCCINNKYFGIRSIVNNFDTLVLSGDVNLKDADFWEGSKIIRFFKL